MRPATSIKQHPRYRDRFPTMALPETATLALAIFGMTIERKPDRFSLHRRKHEGRWCTEVWIEYGNFGLNLSAHLDHYPENFRVARTWVNALAQQYDWRVHEGTCLIPSTGAALE